MLRPVRGVDGPEKGIGIVKLVPGTLNPLLGEVTILGEAVEPVSTEGLYESGEARSKRTPWETRSSRASAVVGDRLSGAIDERSMVSGRAAGFCVFTLLVEVVLGERRPHSSTRVASSGPRPGELAEGTLIGDLGAMSLAGTAVSHAKLAHGTSPAMLSTELSRLARRSCLVCRISVKLSACRRLGGSGKCGPRSLAAACTDLRRSDRDVDAKAGSSPSPMGVRAPVAPGRFLLPALVKPWTA